MLCGPSLRCRQTASGLGLTAEPDDGLRDLDAGHWAGQTLDEVQTRDPEGLAAWLTDPAAAPHGGEPLLAVIDRVGAWLRSRADIGGSVLAVTHPSVIRAAVVYALDAPPGSFWRIDAEPTSYVSLTGHSGRWRLRFARADLQPPQAP